jgi:uncharacterized protein with PQ loop repeat
MFRAVDVVGWAATALFAASYFSQDSAKIRKVQAAAASLWAAYGLLIHSLPVIVSNLIVISMALSTAWRRPREPRDRA